LGGILRSGKISEFDSERAKRLKRLAEFKAKCEEYLWEQEPLDETEEEHIAPFLLNQDDKPVPPFAEFRALAESYVPANARKMLLVNGCVLNVAQRKNMHIV
jgi:hypothetical protein